MEIETFEQTEVTEKGIESTEEQLRLVDELDLDGQRDLLCGQSENTMQLCPYRRMTAEESRVYGAILSQQTKVARYNAGPIPVRVLQVIAHARGLEFFKVLEIWHEPTVETKDPILVGVDDGGKNFLLARWGDVLRPFAELVELAAEKVKRRWLDRCERHLAEGRSALEAAQNLPARDFLGRDLPSAYWH